jgi:hypothetical protein
MLSPNILRLKQNNKTKSMSDNTKYKLLEWVEWATKLLLIGVFTLVWQNNSDMQKLKAQIETQTSAQSSINQKFDSELTSIKAGYMTRMEVLETMKRLEQNQEIMLLRSKLKQHNK